MTIALVQSNSGNSGTVSLPSSVTVGNVIVAVQFNFATLAPSTDNKSNTYTERIEQGDANGNFCSICTAPVTTGGAGFVVTTGGGLASTMWVGEFSGVDAAILDGSAVSIVQAANSTAFTVTTPTITTTISGSVLIAALIDQNSATFTAGGGATKQLDVTTSDRDIVTTLTLGAAGTYSQSFTATATVNNTCSVVAFALKSIIVGPTITAQPVSISVRAGETASFSVTATGATGYQWRKNTSNIGGATSSSYTTPATVLADSGATFDVVVSDGSGSTTSSSATLNVQAGTPSTLGQFDPCMRILGWF